MMKANLSKILHTGPCLLIFGLMLTCFVASAQDHSISITIDDVPNTRLSSLDYGRSDLLDSLSTWGIPFTVFINEGKVYHADGSKRNLDLLAAWINHPKSTAGNHTYNHSRYSEVGYDSFISDVEKGRQLTDSILVTSGTSLTLFRFPFNDLGGDSLQHVRIYNYFDSIRTRIAPFTIESSDWMFSFLYERYLKRGEEELADSLGRAYVRYTLAQVEHFQSLSQAVYGRNVRHIYLCHDNLLNTHYLGMIVRGFEAMGFEIDPLDYSMSDAVYQNHPPYYKKWGISWLYRYMTPEERRRWISSEPEIGNLYQEYERLVQE